MESKEVASSWFGGRAKVSSEEVAAIRKKLDDGVIKDQLGPLCWRIFGDFVAGSHFTVGIFPAGGIQDLLIGGVEPLKAQGKTIPILPELDQVAVYSVGELLDIADDRIVLGFHTDISILAE